ncbi:MAG: glutamate racemase [Deltaproteobacteria bacterium]|nr:glutamate racemase [Deltaproteobacteria bacterium]
MGSNKPIGIFDSGIGGLTVLKEVQKLLPEENFIYLGDTARVPYGTKSGETVLQYSIQNILFLLDHDVKAVVVACNTASAYGLNSLQKNFSVPVLGVIKPGALAAVAKAGVGPIGVIGTEGTIRSQSYAKAIAELNPKIKVVAQACPLLVALAEEGMVKGEIPRLVLKKYLESLTGIRALILGCTHYPLFAEEIGKCLPGVTLVDSAVETAVALGKILEEKGLRQTIGCGKTSFFSTDAPERMQRLAPLFLDGDISPVDKAKVTTY